MRRLTLALVLLRFAGCAGGGGGAGGGRDAGSADGGGDRAGPAPGDAAGGEGDAALPVTRPVADPLRFSMEVGSSISGTLSGRAASGRTVSYEILQMPHAGMFTVDVQTGAFTYRDTGLTAGADSIEYRARDGSDVSAPAWIDITITPFDFNGRYVLTRAGCSDATVLVVQEADRLSISNRSFRCGNQTTTFNLGSALVIKGSDLLSGTRMIGKITDAAISLSDSTYASGCGTVRARFELHRLADGFSHLDEATAPCVAAQSFATSPTYRPAALLLSDGDHDFGVVRAMDTVTHAFTLRNVGKVPATSLVPFAPMAPFAYAGGSYPGDGGDCGAELPAKASCKVVGAATPTTATAPAKISGAVGVSYFDSSADQQVAGSLILAVAPNLKDPVQVTAGGAFRCTRDASGVTCWGDDSQGQTEVPPLTAPAGIEAGFAHGCALDASTLRCWGDNTSGQTTVPALSNPSAVAAGYAHTCAIDGSVKCWGSAAAGALVVPALSNPRQLSSLYQMTCALDDTGVVCWGGSIAVTAPSLTTPSQVSAGASHACALDATGVVCFGNNTWGRVTVPTTLKNPRMVSAGAEHTCALDDTGVVCWGNPDRTKVPPLQNPTWVSAGYYETCAIDGQSVVCW